MARAPKERERQIGEDGAQKQPGAELARNQIAVLSGPAETRRLRQRLFHDRRGIDEDLDFGSLGLGDEPRGEPLEPSLDKVMIIAVSRVNGDISGRFPRQRGKRIASRAIIHAKHDNARGLGPEFARIGTPRLRCGEPVHGARRAGGKPGVESFRRIGNGARMGDAADVEAPRARLLAQ